jgi:hypothetical protein
MGVPAQPDARRNPPAAAPRLGDRRHPLRLLVLRRELLLHDPAPPRRGPAGPAGGKAVLLDRHPRGHREGRGGHAGSGHRHPLPPLHRHRTGPSRQPPRPRPAWTPPSLWPTAGAPRKAWAPTHKPSNSSSSPTAWCLFRGHAGKLDQDEALARLKAIQIIRSQLPTIDTGAIPVPPRPENGHASGRAGLAAGRLDGTNALFLDLRPAYHDLLDPKPATPGAPRSASSTWAPASAKGKAGGSTASCRWTSSPSRPD